jgi:hypothetical protein
MRPLLASVATLHNMRTMDNRDSGRNDERTGSRRYTDNEVALVLRRAAEIEESTGAAGGGGLSLDDLKDIGREVGISPEAIAKAVASLERKGVASAGGLISGSSLVRRAVYSVDGELSPEGIARLIRLVDERSDGAGEVTEALGSVRWTSRDRFRGTQVSITPEKGETTIQVVEKAMPRVRRIVHLVPAAWGGMIAGTVLSGMAANPVVGTSAAGVLLALLLGVGGGAGVGRAVWSWLSGQSRDRVERLATDLSQEAREAVRRGDVVAEEREPTRHNS